MKLFNYVIPILVGLLILTSSCNNKKTYADYLKEERRAIDLLIAKNNFSILREFPADSIFEENEFYKDPNTGVYFNIINLGDPITPKWREKINIRFNGLSYFKENDTLFYSNRQSVLPIELEYIGAINSLTKGNYGTPGLVVPLSYVGHRGKAKLIVPFDMGSSSDQSSFEPTFYREVEYRFESQW
ncbi:DUF4827 family protein [Proteiniphilum sp.]|uniref:DUF4827 family protein n=1 Tax=Proteiniphilum sp. TaxID=1926877 RepID=UPI002B212AE1|nr:DUF4827 family protein [Proteiniphilum sp.]MEA4917040.1 DUF4827 family protein [Proteiniphilum sp.]